MEKAKIVVEVQADSVRQAIAAGVRVAMGTDSRVTPHGRNLSLMIEFGMTALQALHAATLSAVDLGVDGELAPWCEGSSPTSLSSMAIRLMSRRCRAGFVMCTRTAGSSMRPQAGPTTDASSAPKVN